MSAEYVGSTRRYARISVTLLEQALVEIVVLFESLEEHAGD